MNSLKKVMSLFLIISVNLSTLPAAAASQSSDLQDRIKSLEEMRVEEMTRMKMIERYADSIGYKLYVDAQGTVAVVEGSIAMLGFAYSIVEGTDSLGRLIEVNSIETAKARLLRSELKEYLEQALYRLSNSDLDAMIKKLILKKEQELTLLRKGGDTLLQLHRVIPAKGEVMGPVADATLSLRSLKALVGISKEDKIARLLKVVTPAQLAPLNQSLTEAAMLAQESARSFDKELSGAEKLLGKSLSAMKIGVLISSVAGIYILYRHYYPTTADWLTTSLTASTPGQLHKVQIQKVSELNSQITQAQEELMKVLDSK